MEVRRRGVKRVHGLNQLGHQGKFNETGYTGGGLGGQDQGQPGPGNKESLGLAGPVE